MPRGRPIEPNFIYDQEPDLRQAVREARDGYRNVNLPPVRRVLRVREDGTKEVLQIQHVYIDSAGMTVVVR